MIHCVYPSVLQVCYATKSSEADADGDFGSLSREIEVFEKVPSHFNTPIGLFSLTIRIP